MTNSKYRLYKFLSLVFLLLVSCKNIIPTYLVWKNYDLSERGIFLEYSYVTEGMYKKPFIIDFGKFIGDISNGTVVLDSVNSYTVGNYDSTQSKTSIGHCKGQQEYSNFLDPECRFANSWFGVYFIFDDSAGKGKNFILKNPKGNPNDLSNINPDAIKQIPSLDQKLITWSTHTKQSNYYWEDFDSQFYFKQIGEIESSEIKDKRQRSWLKLKAPFETIAAFTDTKLTNMGSTDSIKAMVGIPAQDIYNTTKPWYTVNIIGTTYTKYFPCGHNSFWAVAYYNGSEFQLNSGQKRNYSEYTDIESEFKKMFDEMKLECRM